MKDESADKVYEERTGRRSTRMPKMREGFIGIECDESWLG
jgi:hypothetical protein